MALQRDQGVATDAPLSDAEELRERLEREGTLVLDIKVIPRSQSRGIEGRMPDGKLKVKVRAAPEAGKANNEVCSVFAGYLSVPKANVVVVLGRTSQQKRIRVVSPGRLDNRRATKRS